MTEQFTQIHEEDEISLLDTLVILAESWKLLVFGPIIVGVLAGGLSFMLPQRYESVTIVRISEDELAIINTAPVLDTLIEKFGLLSKFDGVKDDARQYLAKKIVGKADKKTGLATITTTDDAPEKAQELGKAAVDALLKELLPKGNNKKQAEERILINDRIIANLADSMDQLQKQIGKSSQNEAGFDVVMKHYSSLTIELANRQLQNMEIKRSLEGRGDEVFVQQASFSPHSVSPKRRPIVLFAVLASGIVFMIFVFLRKSWASVAQDDEAMRKIALIKKAFQFK